MLGFKLPQCPPVPELSSEGEPHHTLYQSAYHNSRERYITLISSENTICVLTLFVKEMTKQYWHLCKAIKISHVVHEKYVYFQPSLRSEGFPTFQIQNVKYIFKNQYLSITVYKKDLKNVFNILGTKLYFFHEKMQRN